MSTYPWRSRLYAARSTTFGSPTQFAPSGLAGSEIPAKSARSDTLLVNAIHSPSGDQIGLEGPRSSRVTGVTAPSASIQRTKIWLPRGSPGATKRMRVPSGDQRAPLPSSRWRGREPSAFIIHSDDSRRSLILSTHPRV